MKILSSYPISNSDVSVDKNILDLRQRNGLTSSQADNQDIEVPFLMRKPTQKNQKKIFKHKEKDRTKGKSSETSRLKAKELTNLLLLLDQPSNLDHEKKLSLLEDKLESEHTTQQLLDIADGDLAKCGILLLLIMRNAQGALSQRASENYNTLIQQYGSAFRAGVNTASAISSFTNNTQEKNRVRRFYYEQLLDNSSPRALFDQLLIHHEKEGMMGIISTLQRAVAEDIAALTPSVSIGVLRNFQKNLHDVAHVQQAFRCCENFIERLKHILPSSDDHAIKLTRDLLRIMNDGATRQDWVALSEEINTIENDNKILFYNELLPLINSFSLSLWNGKDERKSSLMQLRLLMTEFFNRIDKTAQNLSVIPSLR